MKLSKYAKALGINYRTAHRLFSSGKIIGAYQLPTGTIIVPDNYKLDAQAQEQKGEDMQTSLTKQINAITNSIDQMANYMFRSPYVYRPPVAFKELFPEGIWEDTFPWSRDFKDKEIKQLDRYNKNLLPELPKKKTTEDGKIEVKFTVPGVQKDDIEISYNNGILSVEAKSKVEKEDEKSEYSYSFSEQIGDIEGEIEANLSDGILTISYKPKEEKDTRIQIKVK